MVLITQNPDAEVEVRNVLEQCEGVDCSELQFHQVSIDLEGLRLE